MRFHWLKDPLPASASGLMELRTGIERIEGQSDAATCFGLFRPLLLIRIMGGDRRVRAPTASGSPASRTDSTGVEVQEPCNTELGGGGVRARDECPSFPSFPIELGGTVTA